MMPSRIFPFMTDYQLSAVPLFIFMAAMLEKAGIIEELFDAVYKWLGSVKGGLAVRDGAGLHGARGDGRRGRRDRGDDGHDRAAGDAAARLRPEARLRLAARRRHARHSDPALGDGDRLRGRRAAIAGRVAGRLDLPGPAAVRAVRQLHHSCAATSIRRSARRCRSRSGSTAREKLRLLQQHDRADPADRARARRHLRRHRDAGRGGRHRHLRRAVRVARCTAA